MELAKFAKWVIQEGPWDACDLDPADVQDMAVKCGLLTETTYDPEKHGETQDWSDVEPGDSWFVFSDEMRAALTNEVSGAQAGKPESNQ